MNSRVNPEGIVVSFITSSGEVWHFNNGEGVSGQTSSRNWVRRSRVSALEGSSAVSWGNSVWSSRVVSEVDASSFIKSKSWGRSSVDDDGGVHGDVGVRVPEEGRGDWVTFVLGVVEESSGERWWVVVSGISHLENNGWSPPESVVVDFVRIVRDDVEGVVHSSGQMLSHENSGIISSLGDIGVGRGSVQRLYPWLSSAWISWDGFISSS